MGIKDSDLPKYDKILGVDNKTRETTVAGNVAREAVDVDFLTGSKVVSRVGYSAPVLATALGHSLWGDDMVPFALFVDAGHLQAFFADESAQSVLEGLAPGLPVSYQRINDLVYWSNSAQRGIVGMDLIASDWACANPAGQPDAAAQAAGSFTPGQVQITVTFIDSRGRESGSALPVVIDLAEGQGGIRLTAIPQPEDPDVVAVRIYTSKPNGTVLYRHAQIPVGTTTYTLLGTADGPQLATFNLQPMPAGHIVREFSGRLLVANGRFLMWSEPLRYGLFNPAENYIALPDRLSLMESVSSGTDAAGVFVATSNRTMWLSGRTPAGWQQRIAYPFGAVPGSSTTTSAEAWGLEGVKEPVPCWMATNGQVCVGLPGGQVATFTPDTYAASVGERGAAIMRERDGQRHLLIAQTGAVRNGRFSVGDQVVARTFRYNADGTPEEVP